MSKFRILWIDDQKTKCKKDVKSVKRIIESLGYEPDIDVRDNISKDSLSGIDGELHQAISARDVDLFIIDYNLKNDLFGSDVVEEIRQNHDIYTDIIFYSSMKDSLIEAVKNSFDASSIMEYSDGIYIAPLGDEFSEKVRYVIQKIIKSWYNVHSIRGVVLSKASKFEQMVSDIINTYYNSCLYDIKDALSVKADNVCSNTDRKWKKVKTSNDPVPMILSDPINFNWKVKKLLLEKIDNSGTISVSCWEDLTYIFDLRNLFAHNPMHLVDGILIVTTTKGTEEFTEESIENIRDKLTKIETALSSLIPKGDAGGIVPEYEEEQYEEQIQEKEECLV